jgi:hypothetical protein
MDIFPPPNLCDIHQNEIITVKKVAAASSEPSEQTQYPVWCKPQKQVFKIPICRYSRIAVCTTYQPAITHVPCV